MVPCSNARELLRLLDQKGEEEADTRTWKENLCEHYLPGDMTFSWGHSQPARRGSSCRGVKEINTSIILASLWFPDRAPLGRIHLYAYQVCRTSIEIQGSPEVFLGLGFLWGLRHRKLWTHPAKMSGVFISRQKIIAIYLCHIWRRTGAQSTGWSETLPKWDWSSRDRD